jgi:hypothetical protein
MQATEQFKMRISLQDKAMLASVAKHFQRSQADTVKTLVREVYQAIKNEQVEEKPNNDKSQHTTG